MQSYGVTLKPSQKRSLARAIKKGTSVGIRLSPDALTGPDDIMINATHKNRIDKAKKAGTGVLLQFSVHHLKEAYKSGGFAFIKKLAEMAGKKLLEDVPKLFQDTGYQPGERATPFGANPFKRGGSSAIEGSGILDILQQLPRKINNLMSPTKLFGLPGTGDLINKLRHTIRGYGFSADEAKLFDQILGSGLALPGTGGGLFLPGTVRGGASIGDIMVYSGDGLWLPGTVGVYNGDGILDDIGNYVGKVAKRVKPKLKSAAQDLGDELLDEIEDIATDDILPFMQQKFDKARSKTKKKA
ncbi:MAG: hypothetical protein WDA28_12820 [Castellaniella sp.]